jgi:hypothetical protein
MAWTTHTASQSVHYGGAPPPVYKTETRTRRRRIDEEEVHKLTPKELEFRETIKTQEVQQEKFSEFLKEIPSSAFSHLAPTFLPKEEKKYKGVTVIPSKSQFGEFVLKEGYGVGSRGAGTLHRLQIDPKKQITERPLETIETAINIGAPVVGKGVSALRTPTSVKFIGTSTDDVITGIGQIKTKVGGTKGFGFKQSKIGELTTETGSLTGARGDIITSVSSKGRGVTASETLNVNLQKGSLGELKISEQSGITKFKDYLVGSRSAAAQSGDITAVKGGTTQGITFEGLIKTVGTKTDDIIGTGRSAISESKISQIGRDITSQFAVKPKPSLPISTAKLEPQKPSPSLKITPTSGSLAVGTKTRTDLAITGLSTRQGQRTDSRLGLDIKEKTKPRQRTRTNIISDVAAVSESQRVSEIAKIRPATDVALKQKTKQASLKTGMGVIPLIEVPLKIPIRTPSPLLFKLPSAIPIKKKKTKKAKQPKRYVSTIAASAFEIYGKPTKFGVKSGLGIRPLTRRKAKSDFSVF